MPGNAPGKLSTVKAKTRGEYHFDHSGGGEGLSPAANPSPARYNHIEQCRAAMSGTPMRYQPMPHAPCAAELLTRLRKPTRLVCAVILKTSQSMVTKAAE